MSIKIYGGTASGDEPLCQTCQYAQVLKFQRPGANKTLCMRFQELPK